MLALTEVQDIVNGRYPIDATITERLSVWRDVYFGMSLHTSGACPKFYIYENGAKGRCITPPNYFGIDYQKRFEYLLLASHPREDQATRNWRYSQYRPYTQAPFQQVIETVVGAIFQDANYTIDLPNENDRQYIYSNSFDGYDFVNYIAHKFSSICEDPNGYFVVVPKEPGEETSTTDIRPEIWFIPSKDIIYVGEDDLIFKRAEYRWHFNKIGIFRYQKSNAKKWELADIGGFYAHMFGELRAHKAGGKWNTQGFYESWLNKAKPVADDFIGSKSNEQLVDKEASHPFIVEPDTDCTECTGLGQIQKECDTCDGGLELVTCGTCRGSGKVSRSPGMHIIAPIDKMQHNLVQIINPDVQINAYHNKKNADLYWHILDALSLTKVDQAQSGLAKTIDQERLYQFISNINNDVWDRLIPALLSDIIAYRNVDNQGRPTVYQFTLIKPSQFQIKTAADLLSEFTQAKDAKLPQFLKAQMAVDWVDKQYGGDYILQKKAKFIKEYDSLFTFSPEEINMKLLGGAIDIRMAQYNQMLPVILDQLVRTRGKDWFLKAELAVIDTEVQKIFLEAVPQMPTVIDGYTTQ